MRDLKVLVLNADFIPLNLVPISTISWQDAFTLTTKGNAVPIKFYDDEFVRTPTTSYPVPSVVVVKEYKYFKKHAKWSKFNIKLRDDFKCQYCLKKFSHRSLTIDHVMPKSLGGKHSWENSVTACKSCNQNKKNDKRIVPKRTPYRPTYYELAKKMLNYRAVTNEHWAAYTQFMDSK